MRNCSQLNRHLIIKLIMFLQQVVGQFLPFQENASETGIPYGLGSHFRERNASIVYLPEVVKINKKVYIVNILVGVFKSWCNGPCGDGYLAIQLNPNDVQYSSCNAAVAQRQLSWLHRQLRMVYLITRY